MKKSALILLCAFSLLGSVRCAPTSQASENPVQSSESFKPAQLGIETVELQPSEPGDTVKVWLRGEHWNSCIQYLSAEAESQDGVLKIQISDETPSDLNCATVLTPFKLLVDLGDLAPGDHKVQIQTADKVEEMTLTVR